MAALESKTSPMHKQACDEILINLATWLKSDATGGGRVSRHYAHVGELDR